MSGGVSERVKIIPLMIFTVMMGGLIYPLIVNISWGADFLNGTFLDLHMYDLAGSTVIHSTGGWALLAAILIMGPRKGRYKNGKIKVVPASNIPLVVLGALLLWIGWFGFNGGSVGSISSVENANTVAKTIMNTNTAGLAGAIIAAIIMYMRYKLLDITMVLNGALGGLVAITAGPDLYDVYTPILIGALSVHLVNGIWGTLAVGIFVDSISILDQLKGVVVVAVFAFVSSFVVIYVINLFVKFRATDDAQVEGLDVNEVGVEAYPEFKRAI